jgi:hypothetical protein
LKLSLADEAADEFAEALKRRGILGEAGALVGQGNLAGIEFAGSLARGAVTLEDGEVLLIENGGLVGDR